jgi:hypothetical protein
MKTTDTFSPYDNKVHLFGMISTAVVILAFIGVPLAIQFYFDIDVDARLTFLTFASAISVFGPIAVCEFISYTPILGSSGTYLAFVTGNVMNMKMPAAKNAQKIAGVEAGTPEADAVATIAIGVSSIVTTVILFLGMLLIAQIAPFLSKPVFKPALDNLLPAIFAPLAIPAFVKSFKIASLPVVVTIVITLIFGYAKIASLQSYLLPVFVVLSILWAYFLYKKGGQAK